MTNETKSPFIIKSDFISPLQCESIVDELNLTIPEIDTDGNVLPMKMHSEFAENIVYPKFKAIIPELESHYGLKYKGTTEMRCEWFDEGFDKPEFLCGNSKRINEKWARIYDRDLTAILFLSDYHDKEGFEDEWECYGGKLEFPQHQFGFNPQRSTLVVFPAGPHFINVTAPVHAGELVQIRFHLAAQAPYLYNPEDFPGDYLEWMKNWT